MDRDKIFGNALVSDDEDDDQSSSDSCASDTESEVEGQGTISVRETETSEKQLTLIDDDTPAIVICPTDAMVEADEGDIGEDDEEVVYSDKEEPRGVTIQLQPLQEEVKPIVTKEEEKPKKKKKKRKKLFTICTTNCKYESVRRVAKRFGFKEVSEDDDWNLYWTDYSVALERVMDMKKYQKINHFPGMSEICRKDLLARNMNRMHKLFPKEYNVFPKSWCLPADYGDLQAYARSKKHKTYILKPESGCQGKGIWVTKNVKDIKPHEHMVCQQYVSKPFLIDGFKFDLRVYTLVTSCDPLRVFRFVDGLARFATCKYSEPSNHNTENVYMHLTNYAINKHSDDFVRDDEAGSKRRITTINKWWKEKGYDVDKIWNDVDDVITKTLISAHPILKHNYRTCFPNHVKGSGCFEILGFDIMFDRRLKPTVLEVNHSPSFHTDAKLDKEIKEALLWDTVNLVNFGAVDKRKCIEEERRRIKDRLFQRQNRKETKEEMDREAAKFMEYQIKYEMEHMGNFVRVYPKDDYEKYDKFFQHSGSLFQETAAFKARSECARQQREEILRKKEKLESMLKGKKRDSLRPESPGGNRKRRPRKASVPLRKYNTSRAETLSGHSSRMDQPINTCKPMDIVEEEELERISSLLQRDNLVRGLGIVEHVYRLLHCTPGTMGYIKPSESHSQRAYNQRPAQVAPPAPWTQQSHGPGPSPARKAEKQSVLYRKKGSDNKYYIFHEIGVRHERINSQQQFYHRLPCSFSNSKGPVDDLISRANHLTINDHSSMISSTFNPYTNYGRITGGNQQTSNTYTSWQTQQRANQQRGLMAQYGQYPGYDPRPMPASLQRNRYSNTRRQGFVGGTMRGQGVPSNGALLETESDPAIRYGHNNNNSRISDPMNGVQGQRRTLSANSRQDTTYKTKTSALAISNTPPAQSNNNNNINPVPLYPSIHTVQTNSSKYHSSHAYNQQHNLSVVSAPAPVVQRPELGSANLLGRGGAPLLEVAPMEIRSTKSQRIRGASNTVRLKQLELRENHAAVLS
ncbi:tubulin polyglutamylase ttll6-like isoform X2 [Tubulanus polymorphus]|uniref:tubulin polyglutamylase ttll6-like isoform X2 n=1 Tax=Tubulanus polymorphus TaxID=672921 RepID=UPI003DA23EB1